MTQHNKYLRNQAEYLNDFFEHAPVGFHSFGPDQIIVDINQTELDMLRYNRKEVVGKKRWSDLIIPEQLPLFEKHWQDILKKGKVTNLEYTLIRKDGKKIDVLLNASVRLDKSGRILNTRGSILDITKMKIIQHRLKNSQAKLKQQKMILERNYKIVTKLCHDLESKYAAVKTNIMTNLEEFILPLIHGLKRGKTQTETKNIALLESNISRLAEGFGKKLLDKKWKLSAREKDICYLIKGGLSTKDIADMLCSSIRTVDNHRNHIRKKLGISQKNIDLKEYLQSL